MVIGSGELRGRNWRIGLMPGSFNPPHIGHIELADAAIEMANLSAVVFYANSINRKKRGQLAPVEHRIRLLSAMLRPGMWIVDPRAYPDNPGDAWPNQEAAFIPLIKRLASEFQLLDASDIVLIRGSDNFRPRGHEGINYPLALRKYSHVIGVRESSHVNYDFSQVPLRALIATRKISSTNIRKGLLRYRD